MLADTGLSLVAGPLMTQVLPRNPSTRVNPSPPLRYFPLAKHTVLFGQDTPSSLTLLAPDGVFGAAVACQLVPFQTAAAGPGCGPSVSPTARQNVRDTHDTFCSPLPSGVVAGPGGAATTVHREPSQRCAPVVPIARQKVADVQESPVTRPMAAPRGIRHGPPAAVRTSTEGTPLGTGASGGSEKEVAAAQNLVPAQETLASRPLIRGVCCTRYGVVGGPTSAYGAYYYGNGCSWLRYRALETGSRYWWSRYYACVNGYGY